MRAAVECPRQHTARPTGLRDDLAFVGRIGTHESPSRGRVSEAPRLVRRALVHEFLGLLQGGEIAGIDPALKFPPRPADTGDVPAPGAPV